MSRAYIVTRNGGTVTKAPINDNKIPIYANETALDADLSNLPDGTICATKGGHDDVIDQMKEYIRKQNVLSDYETKHTAGTGDTTYIETPNFDGFIYVIGKSPNDNNTYTDVQLTINSVFFSEGHTGYGVPTLVVPFRKGDTVSVQSGWGTGTTHTNYFTVLMQYYKDRDYTGR